MIVTDTLKYIPFRTLSRKQVAELMGRSPGAVDYYVKRGAKVCQGHIIYLRKESNGTFLTTDVIDFLDQLKNKSS
jgi:predicted transcriptional regulator